MGHSQASKAASRQRILDEAARRLRREGIDGLGIAGLMQAAGMTHGGFYKHFPSRAALVEAALERALTDGHARAAGSAADLPGRLRAYLSRTHRDAGAAACAISVLAGEVGRGPAGTKVVMAPQVEAFIEEVAAVLGGDADRAALLVSAMVGAITLARVLPAERSEALLRAVREQLLAAIGGAEPRASAPALSI